MGCDVSFCLLLAEAKRTVAVLDTGHLEETLGSGGGNDTGTTGCGDQTAHDRTVLAGHLAGHGVGLSDVGTPVTATDGDDGELGGDDGTTDGGSDFLGALDTETDVSERSAEIPLVFHRLD